MKNIILLGFLIMMLGSAQAACLLKGDEGPGNTKLYTHLEAYVVKTISCGSNNETYHVMIADFIFLPNHTVQFVVKESELDLSEGLTTRIKFRSNDRETCGVLMDFNPPGGDYEVPNTKYCVPAKTFWTMLPR
jgi:hypothetical protein